MEPTADFDQTALRQAVAGVFSDLAEAALTPLAGGWDSMAYDLGGKVIVKRPRHEAAALRLRCEAAVLAVVRPRLSLPVPDLHLVEAPLLSWHPALPGAALEAADYDALSNADRHRLAETLARFYAQLHTIAMPHAPKVQAWLPAEALLAKALPLLPAVWQALAARLIGDWAALPPDPLGEVFGHFDGHGWNMAFDHATGSLNGIYDFGDAGVGPRHREFIYAGLTSFDLSLRVARSYAQATGLAVDLGRIGLLTGVHRLWELAGGDPKDHPALVHRFEVWAQSGMAICPFDLSRSCSLTP